MPCRVVEMAGYDMTIYMIKKANQPVKDNPLARLVYETHTFQE